MWFPQSSNPAQRPLLPTIQLDPGLVQQALPPTQVPSIQPALSNVLTTITGEHISTSIQGHCVEQASPARSVPYLAFCHTGEIENEQDQTASRGDTQQVKNKTVRNAVRSPQEVTQRKFKKACTDASRIVEVAMHGR